MNNSPSIQETINECHQAETSETRLLDLLADERVMVRANAMLAVGSRAPESESSIIDALLSVAHVANDRKPLIGTMTERMLVAYTLYSIGTRCSLEAAREIESLLSRDELEDLRWNIQNNPAGPNQLPSNPPFF